MQYNELSSRSYVSVLRYLGNVNHKPEPDSELNFGPSRVTIK
jgi:hypothetical protein